MKRPASLVAALAAVFVAASLALGATGARADNTVEVSVVPGTTLTATLASDATMTVAASSHAEQRSTGTLTLRVEDGRGTSPGWRVTITAADFRPTGALAADPIPARGFRLVAAGALTAEVGATDGIVYGEPGTPLHAGQVVMRAAPGYGTGIYHQDLEVELDIPAQTPAGLYEAQITVAITSAPGS